MNLENLTKEELVAIEGGCSDCREFGEALGSAVRDFGEAVWAGIVEGMRK